VLVVMLQYVCPVFSMRLEYRELLLLLPIAWICSLYLVLKVCTVQYRNLNLCATITVFVCCLWVWS
jgi:hypothetical protein